MPVALQAINLTLTSTQSRYQFQIATDTWKQMLYNPIMLQLLIIKKKSMA
jgi:hypothetical protein